MARSQYCLVTRFIIESACTHRQTQCDEIDAVLTAPDAHMHSANPRRNKNPAHTLLTCFALILIVTPAAAKVTVVWALSTLILYVCHLDTHILRIRTVAGVVWTSQQRGGRGKMNTNDEAGRVSRQTKTSVPFGACEIVDLKSSPSRSSPRKSDSSFTFPA